jgi:small subunit ribosomal protein S1
MVINVDRKNRGINLSIKAKEMSDEAQAMQQVANQQPSNAGLTNLGALLKAKLDNSRSE